MEDVSNVLQESSDRVSVVDADDLENELDALLNEGSVGPNISSNSSVDQRISALPPVPSQQMVSRQTPGALHSAYASVGIMEKPKKDTGRISLHTF